MSNKPLSSRKPLMRTGSGAATCAAKIFDLIMSPIRPLNRQRRRWRELALIRQRWNSKRLLKILFLAQEH